MEGLLRFNDWESSTDETTVSAGNSSSATSNSLDLISIGAGNTFVFDNATAAHGTFAGRFTSGGTAAGYVGWDNLGALTQECFFGSNIRVSALPTVGTWFGIVRLAVAAGTRVIDVDLRTDGLLRISDSAGTEIVPLRGASAISAATWFRFECWVIPGTAGSVTWRWFSTVDSSTPIETKSAGSATIGASITQVRLGHQATPANVSGLSAWFDDTSFIPVSRSGLLKPMPLA